MSKVLDHGYCNLVESWGSDEAVIAAARMSTSKGFQGWGPGHSKECQNPQRSNFLDGCNCSFDTPGDEKLLRYLWEHKHATPFEMGGMVVEVQAPIFVTREWFRHRTQSYNELSSRYTALPDLFYIPSIERIMAGKQAQKNKQGSEDGFNKAEAASLQIDMVEAIHKAREVYEKLLKEGVSRELARLVIPVTQYTRFRASANLRNWFSFLALRLDKAAQFEICCYAEAVAALVADKFPRSYTLFREGLND